MSSNCMQIAAYILSQELRSYYKLVVPQFHNIGAYYKALVVICHLMKQVC